VQICCPLVTGGVPWFPLVRGPAAAQKATALT
jgi:hypothetical protein